MRNYEGASSSQPSAVSFILPNQCIDLTPKLSDDPITHLRTSIGGMVKMR